MTTQTVMKLQARLVALMLAVFLLPLGAVHAGSAAEIDASVDAELSRFKKEVKGANDYRVAATGTKFTPLKK